MSSIWISIGPILVINFVTVVTFLIFLARRNSIPPASGLAGRYQSRLLGRVLQEYWYWLIDPIARFFVKLRFSPNILTFIGFTLNLVAAYLFALGSFGYAGWVMIAGSTFDLFDGQVARVTGRMTRSGAFFDSVMDRFSEGAVFAGLAYYYHATWLLPVILIGLIGSMLVSYTRARGEGVGVVCKKGPMQRQERIAYLGIGSVLQPVADAITHRWWADSPAVLVVAALCLIAFFTIYTAIYRLVFIMNALDTTDRARDGHETIPQLLTQLSTREGRERFLQRARYGYDRGQARYLCALTFVSDGVHADVVRELCRRGELPNIQRHIIGAGSYFEATTVFPSIGGPAALPLVTGCFPGTCNIPGMRWFDRTVPPEQRFTLKRVRDYSALGAYAIDYDLAKGVPTVFESSRQAVNLLGLVNRGAGLRGEGAMTRAHLEQREVPLDDVEGAERTVFEAFTACLRRQPDLIFYHFPTIGRVAARYGIDAPQTRAAYRRFDRAVGDAVELLKTHGLFDHTLLVWGNESAAAERRAAGGLDELLLRRLQRRVSQLQRRSDWRTADCLDLVSGNAMAHLYLRRDRSWSPAHHYEELEHDGMVAALFEEPAVDLVMARSANGGVIVGSRRGAARLTEDGQIGYEVIGSDPFGYGPLPSRCTVREALSLTAGSAYPDGIMQALQLFRSVRTGDLVISATPGMALDASPSTLSAVTMGSMDRSHLVVPCAISARVRTTHPIRTVDLLPTVLQLVGLQPEGTLDGVVLDVA